MLYKNIDNKKTEEFFLLMNRKLVLKYFQIVKIFHIKKMILFSFNMIVFIKFQVKLFMNVTELNPQNMPETNIKSSCKNVGRKQIFLREILKIN